MKADYDFENNTDGRPTPSMFTNVGRMFQIAVAIAAVIGIIILISVLTNPEKVGEFMAKIVNGFNSTLK